MKPLNLALVVGIVLSAMTITSCKTTKINNDTTYVKPSKGVAKLSPEIVDSLTGDWSVVSVGTTPIKSEKLPTVNLSLPDSEVIFDGDIVLCYAFNGCNTINGKFKVEKDHKISPSGDFISTMMICPGVDYDQMVTEAVNVVTSYDLKSVNGESTLNLYNKNGKKMLTLRKHDIEFFNGAWRVTRLGADTLVPEDTGMEMVIDLPQGTVHANGGCNVINGKIEPVMDVDGGVKFFDFQSTRMYCPAMELEQTLLANLKETKKVVRGSDKDTALLLNANGAVLVVLKHLDMKDLQSAK